MAESTDSHAHTPPVRDAGDLGAANTPESEKRSLPGDESDLAPTAPKTSGAPVRGKEPLVNPVADRNIEGPRQAGMTPRPTDKPISDGDKG